MMPTKRMPTISNDVAIGRRMNGPEIPPAMSVSRSGFGLRGRGARGNGRRVCGSQRFCIDQRAIEQARLPGDHDLVPYVETFGDYRIGVAVLTDLDGLGANLAVTADHVGKKP